MFVCIWLKGIYWNIIICYVIINWFSKVVSFDLWKIFKRVVYFVEREREGWMGEREKEK